jgi:eukaryotic-like serine/threonine-protein kinase
VSGSTAGYMLRRRLDSGHGTTQVWEAVAPDRGRVALKRFHPRDDAPEAVFRFRLERELLTRLGGSHSLIRCLDAADDPPITVLEWAGGGSLRDRLHPRGRDAEAVPLPEPAVTAIAKQVGEALTWLHEHGVLHRDVKPSNVLVMDDGSVRLADLGVAATGHPPRGLPLGWVEEAVGTLGYAAPELLAVPIDASPAVDVYGLGATLYELLTGHLPHDLGPGESEAAYRARIVAGEPAVPLAARRWTGSRTLGELITRSLEADPARRPATVATLIAIL